MGIFGKFARWVLNLFVNNKTELHDNEGNHIEGSR
jgi:hypothetical protein